MAIDSNGDKGIDKTEALRFLGTFHHGLHPNGTWFEEMDVNGDGTISPHEFDSDLSDE